MDFGRRHIVLAAIGACVTAAAGHATTADAHGDADTADWNGVWVIAGSFMDKQDGTSLATPGRFNAADLAAFSANRPAYKGDYLKQFQARLQAAGRPVDDSARSCLPPGMPGFWAGPYAFEILLTPQRVNIYQEAWQQTRRIYLDERRQPVPDDLNPSYNGHSIGHWEGDALVVDTVGVRTDTPRMPHSEAMHINERLQAEGPDRLKVVMTVDDPNALSKPWVDVIHLHRKHGMRIMEYVCEQNNRAIP